MLLQIQAELSPFSALLFFCLCVSVKKVGKCCLLPARALWEGGCAPNLRTGPLQPPSTRNTCGVNLSWRRSALLPPACQKSTVNNSENNLQEVVEHTPVRAWSQNRGKEKRQKGRKKHQLGPGGLIVNNRVLHFYHLLNMTFFANKKGLKDSCHNLYLWNFKHTGRLFYVGIFKLKIFLFLSPVEFPTEWVNILDRVKGFI